MTATVTVTFEFELRSPQTWSGKVEAYSVETLARRGVDRAYKQLRPRAWMSVICVISERSDFKSEVIIDGSD